MTLEQLRLKEARQRKGYTQAEIGNVLGVTQQAYQKLESGITTDMRISTLKKICESLDISADWLLGLFDQEDLNSTMQFYSKIIDLVDDYNAVGLIPDDKIDEVINDINEIYTCFQE